MDLVNEFEKEIKELRKQKDSKCKFKSRKR